jgi:hypothetical protein
LELKRLSNVGFTVGALLLVLNIMDAVISHELIFRMGLQELSPIINYFMQYLGVFWLIPKILIGLVASGMFIIYWEKYRIARVGGVAALLIYIIVTMWHIFGLHYIS